ncbi:8031_t:CDS:10 [Cetraspora pellucida]|uniref:8031_t:CDS:1 n=1 Tax=Cetraspora pellucida TaxID=1433469 RepID=A0ACA9K1I9_9GLOM|nr:8031_t:CDS:10 [Cetraspora pellucida]
MRYATIENNSGKKFTWEELAKHNKPDDAYVAVRGNVYDITSFIERHPGGDDILLLAAGRDITQAFETYHELGKPDVVLKKFFVGTLVTNELPIFPEPSGFHRAMKKNVEEYFRKTEIDPKNSTNIWIRYAIIYGMLVGSYYAQFYLPYVVERIWLQIIFAISLGFACAQLGLNQLHDASHFAVTNDPFVWKILGATHDFFNGASYLVWLYQHAFGHHIYTNIAGCDPDLSTDDPDIRRIKPSQRWYSRYVNQHLFVPILYGFLAIKVRIQDITVLYFVGSNDKIRINPITTWHTCVFWSGKVFFVLHRIIIPLMISFSAWKVFLLFAIADAVSSYWLALTFQANHVVGEVEWPLPDKDGLIQKDWAEMQIITTQDYAHDSRFITSIVGSLNYQAVHHVFPQVSQHHYHRIGPIVKETCREFGVRFYYKNTLWEAIGSHIRHLRFLGLKPEDHSKTE